MDKGKEQANKRNINKQLINRWQIFNLTSSTIKSYNFKTY